MGSRALQGLPNDSRGRADPNARIVPAIVHLFELSGTARGVRRTMTLDPRPTCDSFGALRAAGMHIRGPAGRGRATEVGRPISCCCR